MQYWCQMMKFWFMSCSAILQLSHQDMVTLHNTEPLSTYCYRVHVHRRIVTLEIGFLDGTDLPSCSNQSTLDS